MKERENEGVVGLARLWMEGLRGEVCADGRGLVGDRVGGLLMS